MRRLGQNPSPKELEGMIRDVDADGEYACVSSNDEGQLDFGFYLVRLNVLCMVNSLKADTPVRRTPV